MISQALDSKTLPWLAIPATQPYAPTQGHPGTCHTMITVEREKKGRVVGGKQKNKRTINAENNALKKIPYNALPNVLPNIRYSEAAGPT